MSHFLSLQAHTNTILTPVTFSYRSPKQERIVHTNDTLAALSESHPEYIARENGDSCTQQRKKTQLVNQAQKDSMSMFEGVLHI